MNKRILLLWLLIPAGGLAQPYSIDWHSIGHGGGTGATGQYIVSGTSGQPDAGQPGTAGNYSVAGGFWQIPGGPRLSVRLVFPITSPVTVVVSWSAPALGCFVLQQTDSLETLNWADVTAPATFTNGTNEMVLPASGNARFYRLISTCPQQ